MLPRWESNSTPSACRARILTTRHEATYLSPLTDGLLSTFFDINGLHWVDIRYQTTCFLTTRNDTLVFRCWPRAFINKSIERFLNSSSVSNMFRFHFFFVTKLGISPKSRNVAAEKFIKNCRGFFELVYLRYIVILILLFIKLDWFTFAS